MWKSVKRDRKNVSHTHAVLIVERGKNGLGVERLLNTTRNGVTGYGADGEILEPVLLLLPQYHELEDGDPHLPDGGGHVQVTPAAHDGAVDLEDFVSGKYLRNHHVELISTSETSVERYPR